MHLNILSLADNQKDLHDQDCQEAQEEDQETSIWVPLTPKLDNTSS